MVYIFNSAWRPLGMGPKTPNRMDSWGQAYQDVLDNYLSHPYNNTCGLPSNFTSAEYHLSSAEPGLLYLTETQVSAATERNPFSVSSYIILSPCVQYLPSLVFPNLTLLNSPLSGFGLPALLKLNTSVWFISQLNLLTTQNPLIVLLHQ